MTITITGVSNISTTTARLNLAGNVAGTMDVQYSPRPDFEFCVCPTFNVASNGFVDLVGLNQRGSYWVRARNRPTNGDVEDWSLSTSFRTYEGTLRSTTPAPIMIEPAKIVVPARVTSVQTTGDRAGFPPSNLFRDSPVAWRGTPNGGGDYAIYVFIGSQPIDTLALLNTNLPEAASIVITGGPTIDSTNSGADWQVGGPARATANLPQRMGYHASIDLGAVRYAQWVRVLISGCVVSGGVLHIEHMILGLNRVSKNHAVEKTEAPVPMTTVERRRSGMVDRVKGRPMRKVDFELQMLTEAQYETIYGDLWRYENEPVLVIPNSKSGAFLHDRILFGDLGGGRIVTPTSPRYSRSFSVNSII